LAIMIDGKEIEIHELMHAFLATSAKRACMGDTWHYRDAYNEGVARMLTAAKKYDPAKGGPLATFLALYGMGGREATRAAAIEELTANGPEMDRPIYDEDGNEVLFGEEIAAPEPVDIGVFMLPWDTIIFADEIGMLVQVPGQPARRVPEGKEFGFTMQDAGDLANPEPVYIGVAPKPAWDPMEFVAAMFDDEDPSEFISDDHDQHKPAWKVAQEGNPSDWEDFFGLDDLGIVGVEEFKSQDCMGSIIPDWQKGPNGEMPYNRVLRVLDTNDSGQSVVFERDENGAVIKDPAEPTDQELDDAIEALSMQIPSDWELYLAWEEFRATLKPVGTFSVAYQAAVVMALAQGNGWKAAINMGKMAHKHSLKVAPKGATPTQKEGATMEQTAIRMAGDKKHEEALSMTLALLNTHLPSNNSWARAQKDHTIGKVQIKHTEAVGDMFIAWALVKSSQNGPIPYQTIVAYRMDEMGNKRLVKAHCNCAANDDGSGCYHEAGVMLALQH